MQWVGETIKVYGGDPNQIHVLVSADGRDGERSFPDCLGLKMLEGVGLWSSCGDAGRGPRGCCALTRRSFPHNRSVSARYYGSIFMTTDTFVSNSNIKPDPTSPLPSSHLDISSGIRRCQIWGAEATLPPIAGMMLVSGVYDVVKQLRYEAKTGIEDCERTLRYWNLLPGLKRIDISIHVLQCRR